MVINRDHDHDYEDHDDSSKDYNGQQKRAEPGNDYGEYNDDDGCGGDYDDGQHSGQEECAEPDNDDDEYNDDDDGGGDDYDDGGQHSGQQGHAEPASKISSVSSAAACIPTPCFQTHKTAGLSSTAESSSLWPSSSYVATIIISLCCIITP